MKSISKYTLLIFSLLPILFACSRRPLENEYFEKALIPIGTVWSAADITPQNVTALFYDQADGHLVLEHRFENISNRIQTYAELPVGNYTVVLFNEIRDQISSVGIRGHENFATLEAFAKPNPTDQVRINRNTSVAQPGILAVAMVRDFSVTPEFIVYSQHPDHAPLGKMQVPAVEKLVGLVPERKVSDLRCTVDVNGLNNARMPVLTYIHNMSEGYSFANNANTMTPASYQFTMNNRTYNPGSIRDGTISATVKTFGVLGDRTSVHDQPTQNPIVLDMIFMLVDADKTIVNHAIDITDQIEFSSENSSSIKLELRLRIEEKLPDVVPETSNGDSGFNTDLIDWRVVDVPLITKSNNH